MSEIKTDKPKLTWIDIAITVTLLASIVGLAAWLLSGKFSYIAAPASSFGLVNLLKKPKEEEEQESTEASNPVEGVDDSDRSKAASGGQSAVIIPPSPTPLEPTIEPTPSRVDRNPNAGFEPFDGSLLDSEPGSDSPTQAAELPEAELPDTEAIAAEPIYSNQPPSPTLTSASDQPLRYLDERYSQGERNFQRFDLRNINLNYRSLRLVGADLRELTAERASLQQIDLTQANLGRANFQYANLDGANLSYSNLAAADFNGASLRGANLRDANLADARLAIADLSYADLSGADLRGADLTDANLYRARLDGAKLPTTMRRV